MRLTGLIGRIAGIGMVALAACDDGGGAVDGGADSAVGAGDMAFAAPDMAGCPAVTVDTATCMPLASDYQPRLNMSMSDTWPACITDDNMHHQIGMSPPGGVVRVAAFESIGDKLWKRATPPAAADFLAARDEYTVPNGLASRIERRQDIHYPDIPNNSKTRCSEPGIPETYPDRCVGPTKLAPFVNEAFMQGLAGNKPRVQAARIEFGILWWFYLSAFSEAWTCGFEALEDCDSTIGNYNGYVPRDNVSQGLARYIAELSPLAHDRVVDAALAYRCWRDIDDSMPTVRQDLYDLAYGQIDRALNFGMMQVLKSRMQRSVCLSGDLQEGEMAFVNVLGEYMDRAVRAIDATKADQLKAIVSKATVTQADVATASGIIDALFVCP